jgi:hypothetical protein
MAKFSFAVGSEYLEFPLNLLILFRGASIIRIVEWFGSSLFKDRITSCLSCNSANLHLMERSRRFDGDSALGSPVRRTRSFPWLISGSQADRVNNGGAIIDDGVKTHVKLE